MADYHVRQDYAERMATLKERHSERLRSLAASTERLKKHNDLLEARMQERGQR